MEDLNAGNLGVCFVERELNLNILPVFKLRWHPVFIGQGIGGLDIYMLSEVVSSDVGVHRAIGEHSISNFRFMKAYL